MNIKGFAQSILLNSLLQIYCMQIDNLYFNLDISKTCIGVFLAVSKAFNPVNHTISINKLSSYGIRGTTSNWIESYISD